MTFASVSSPLTINDHAYTLANSLATLAANINTAPSGFHAFAKNCDASNDGTYSGHVIGDFPGTFDGLGNTVSNLSISGGSTGAGFFFQIDNLVEHFNLRG